MILVSKKVLISFEFADRVCQVTSPRTQTSQVLSRPSFHKNPTQRDCPPVTKVCNDARVAESLFPMNGPRVGGTVIRISRTYLCTERNQIYCKFKNSGTSVVTEAYKLDKVTVECVSSPSNSPVLMALMMKILIGMLVCLI